MRRIRRRLARHLEPVSKPLPRRLATPTRRVPYACASAFAALAWGAVASGAAHAAPAEYQAAVLQRNPVLYYQLDEDSGDAVNHGSLGTFFDGLYQGSVVRAIPTLGGDAGVSFDGVGDFIESISAAPAGLTGNPTFTAETVIRVPLEGSASLWAPFLHWGPSDPGAENGRSVYFSFSNNAADEVFVGFYNAGLQTPAMTLERDTWHHLVWIRQGGGTSLQGSKLWVDGVDVSASLVPDPDLVANGITPDVGSTAFRVNRARDFDALRFFVGDMDELVLYDRALTAGEVLANYRMLVPEPDAALSGWAVVVTLALRRARGSRISAAAR